MILEHVWVRVAAADTERFEGAYAEAVTHLVTSPGCRGAALRRGVEDPERYLLLVEWETLEDHTVGFRGSEAFAAWRELVGPCFAEPPEVAHFKDVPTRD